MHLAKLSHCCLLVAAIVTFFAPSVAVYAQGDQDTAPTVESIINRHIESIGTKEKIDSITALLVESTTFVETPAGKITSTMRQNPIG